MNKLAKGLMITALIFILIGMITVISALAVGGIDNVVGLIRSGEFNVMSNSYSYSDWEEDWEDEWKDEWNDSSHPESSELKEVAIDDLPNMEKVRKLNIDAGEGKFYIRTTEDENYSIESNFSNKLSCYMSDNELFIMDENENYGNSKWRRKLYLNIPKDAKLSDIIINIGAGVLNAESLSAEDIDIVIGAGKIEVLDMTATEASISVGAGAADVKKAKLEEADITVAAGKIEIEGTIERDLEADCSMGRIKLLLEGKEEDHNYDIDSSMGSIRIGSNETVGITSERYMDYGANSEISLSCDMGQIDIEFKQ